jgi:hypothetical protein
MNTLTHPQAQSLQLQKETVTIDGATFEVDLHLTDWQACLEGQPTVTMLAEIFSVELDEGEEYPIPAWDGVVACTVTKPTKEAIIALIRSFDTLSASHYEIGHIWKPEPVYEL